MTVQAQRRGGRGPFCLLCCVGLLALGFVVAVGETAIEVVPRADGHVESKHGTAAREVLQRPEPCEWHYSPSRQVVMRSRCDATTCAVSFLGAQGRGIAAASFAPALMGGAAGARFCSARCPAMVMRAPSVQSSFCRRRSAGRKPAASGC